MCCDHSYKNSTHRRPKLTPLHLFTDLFRKEIVPHWSENLQGYYKNNRKFYNNIIPNSDGFIELARICMVRWSGVGQNNNRGDITTVYYTLGYPPTTFKYN